VTQKLSTDRISTQLSFLGFSVAFLPIAAWVMLSFPVDLHISLGVLLLGAAGGALNGLGTLASFAAFESGGKASVVIPIVSLYPLVTVLGARIFFQEQISNTQWAGILLAPLAAWLLSCDSTAE
jgi:drug/metabolite transporter (DMT)-like permease